MVSPVKTYFIVLSMLLALSCGNAQNQFQPEDVLHTVDNFQLKYKHVMAYVDMEMEGEDPALLNDQAYMQELTVECIEEFVEEPELFLADMEAHYEAMQAGLGYLSQHEGQDASRQQIQENDKGTSNYSSRNGQWNQLLSGSVLYYTVTQSQGGLFVQSTQYMHLCPNGTALMYQNSGGGGGAITAPGQVEFTGSTQWAVVEQGQQAFFQVSLQGTSGNFPMKIVNQKVQIQGLGTFTVQQGAAQCN